MDYRDPDVLKELAEQKEKEWKDITDRRLQSLETALAEKDRQLSQQSEKFQKLKDDFKYNLKLLEERDQELERYDISFTDLKAQLNLRSAELSELQIKLDDRKKMQEREQKARDDLHAKYQQRLREKEAEIEAFKNTKNGELQQERNEFDSLRRTLQRQLIELQAELAKQRQELSTEFEDALKTRENEFRRQVDEMNAKVLEYDLKAQLLSKELGLVRVDQQKNSEQAEEAFQGQRDLEKQLKQAQWQTADVTAMKDARIKELTGKLEQQEKAAALLQENFQRKYAELDRSMREHEASAQRVKAACEEKEQASVRERQQLQSKLEDAQIQVRQLQWTNSDLKKNHEMTVEKLQDEIQQLQSRWDSNLKDMSRDAVTRDVELQAAHEEIGQLKSDLAQRKDDLDRYKKELQQATEREKSLEQTKTQVELDWQRRCDELERRQYNKSEDLIISLTQARDEALAEYKEKGRELEQNQMLLRVVSRDRDLALATLKKHDIPLDKNIQLQSEKLHEQEMANLQDQNKSLRAALASMKQMMESMGHSMPTAVSIEAEKDNDYLATLEKEVKKLKSEKRDLSEKVAMAERFGRLVMQPPVDSEPILSEVKDSNVRNHIRSLNDSLGVLRGEKVELAAAVKKQQARIQHLEGSLEEAMKEPQELQVTLEQLRYELGVQQRRHAAEAAAQKQRITLLEGQLTEAQREADMFHQASVENNSALTALRNKVSALKLELADKHPAVNFGAQELVIQQLQEELKTLRERSADLGFGAQDKGGHGSAAASGGVAGSGLVSELRSKLQQAAKHIAQLVKEKQQLLELSNKLRAELKMAGVQPTLKGDHGPKAFQMHTAPKPSEQDIASRLSQLERLQYELTRQELQYAQRFAPSPNRDSRTPERDLHKRALSPAGDNLVKPSMATTASSLRASSQLPGGGELTSSLGSQSYREMLRTLEGPESLDLDFNYSPTPSKTDIVKSSMEQFHQRDGHSAESSGILVSGQRVKVDQKGNSGPSWPLSSKASGKVQKGKGSLKPRIRNYNVHDDGDFR